LVGVGPLLNQTPPYAYRVSYDASLSASMWGAEKEEGHAFPGQESQSAQLRVRLARFPSSSLSLCPLSSSNCRYSFSISVSLSIFHFHQPLRLCYQSLPSLCPSPSTSAHFLLNSSFKSRVFFSPSTEAQEGLLLPLLSPASSTLLFWASLDGVTLPSLL